MTRSPHAFSLIITLAAGLLTACNSTVQGGEGGGGTGGAAASGGDGGGDGNDGPAASTTAATARWITPELEAELCGQSSPCNLPDASILLVIDSAHPVCGTPIQRTWGSGDGFRIALALPPSMQVEGRYILEETPGIAMTQGIEFDGGGTVGGGPSGWGTLEIVAIDELSMTVRIEGMAQAWNVDELGNETLVYDTDGEYVTAPCE